MDLPTAILSFALVAGVVTIIPGADTALVLRVAVAGGRRAAITTALGICTGALIWGTAAAGGISLLLTASHAAYTAVRVAGAVYLVYLGSMMLRDALRRPAARHQQQQQEAAGARVERRWRDFGRGVATNLLNPKVGIFYAAMLPQFLPADLPALPVGMLLALIHDLEAMAWFALIIAGVGLARRWWAGGTGPARYARRAIDAIAGTVLVALGLRLGLDR